VYNATTHEREFADDALARARAHAAVLLESREYSVDLSWPLGGNCEVAREIVTFGAHVSQPDLNPWMPRVSR